MAHEACELQHTSTGLGYTIVLLTQGIDQIQSPIYPGQRG